MLHPLKFCCLKSFSDNCAFFRDDYSNQGHTANNACCFCGGQDHVGDYCLWEYHELGRAVEEYMKDKDGWAASSKCRTPTFTCLALFPAWMQSPSITLFSTNRCLIHGVVLEQQSYDALRYIKIFLTTMNRFAIHGRIPTTSGTESETKLPRPLILSKFDFITLLKIPCCMLHFGSLHLLWEGDGKGEGALQDIGHTLLL
jgi:hypothetical protein